MSNALTIPQGFGAVSSRFKALAEASNDLSAGISGGFGVIGYKGKVWSIRYRGDEIPLMRPDGDGPRGSIEVIILKAASVVSKVWYETGWVEGSSAPPDCLSSNGVTPDNSAVSPQSAACATCPRNAWGSRLSATGKAAKACSDTKRLVVVPLEDPRNEVYGGPMLLRVPTASLNDLAQFGAKLHALGYHYSSIAVRISFDTSESYPKFVFHAVRTLTDEEADIVIPMIDDPAVARILSESEGLVAAAVDGRATEAPASEAPKPVQAPSAAKAPAPKPVAAKAPAPKAPASQPAVQATPAAVIDTDALDADIDAILNS